MKTVDDYIANATEVTRPILSHLRKLINQAEPNIVENIKWNAPSFEYRGKIVCNMMAFKKHVNLMFHQGKEFKESNGVLENIGVKSNMKGIKGIQSVSDLPDDMVLMHFIKQGVNLVND